MSDLAQKKVYITEDLWQQAKATAVLEGKTLQKWIAEQFQAGIDRHIDKVQGNAGTS